MKSFSSLHGMTLRENSLMVIRGPDQTVARTWSERLFTLPWRPHVATRVEMTFRPDPHVIVMSGRMIIGHPATIRALVAAHATPGVGQ